MTDRALRAHSFWPDRTPDVSLNTMVFWRKSSDIFEIETKGRYAIRRLAKPSKENRRSDVWPFKDSEFSKVCYRREESFEEETFQLLSLAELLQSSRFWPEHNFSDLISLGCRSMSSLRR